MAISGIYAIGNLQPCSRLGTFGSAFCCSEWGYPPIGIYFADCPSSGHDMLCLDYRRCGKTGDPRVVHVDQELNDKITNIADNVESAIRGIELAETVD